MRRRKNYDDPVALKIALYRPISVSTLAEFGMLLRQRNDAADYTAKLRDILTDTSEFSLFIILFSSEFSDKSEFSIVDGHLQEEPRHVGVTRNDTVCQGPILREFEMNTLFVTRFENNFSVNLSQSERRRVACNEFDFISTGR